MSKVNYKYLNVLLLLGNIYLLFLLKNVWMEAVLKIFDILFPFVLGFSLAYVFYPLVKIINKKIPDRYKTWNNYSTKNYNIYVENK